jgi:hypothetical protein
VAFDAGSRIDFAVDLMLIEIVSTMWQCTFYSITKLGAGFELFLVRMAIGAEGFLMAGSTGEF